MALWQYLIQDLIPRIWQVLSSPWMRTEALWTVLPFVVILFLIHIYFGRHRSEELGWNSAFGNAVSLLWVCVILSRHLLSRFDTISEAWQAVLANTELFREVILVGALLAWVLLLLTFNFFHVLPKRLAFTVSSSRYVYVLAYIVISVIMGDVPMDGDTFAAGVVIFLLLSILFELVLVAVPMSRGAKGAMAKKKRKEKREKAAKKAARTRKWNTFKERTRDRWEHIKEGFTGE